MAVAELNVELREGKGRQLAQILRRNGKVPAIFYSPNTQPISISVDTITFNRLISSEAHVLDLIFPDKKKKKCIIRDIQLDPVREEIIHVDFMGIKLDEKVNITIPLVLIGTPVGVTEQGGILEHILREVEVEGLPLDIPEHLEVDVSHLEIGNSMHLKDIPLEKIEFKTDPEHEIANVIAPKKIEAEAELEAAEEGVEGEEVTEEDKEAEEETEKEEK